MFLADNIFNPEPQVRKALYVKCQYINSTQCCEEGVPLATSFNPTLSIALSRALPMRNSSDKSALPSAQTPSSICQCAHSIFSSDPRMSVAVVSCSSQPPTGLGRPGQCLSRQRCLNMSIVGSILRGLTYSSSQLNKERASVVSTCFTKSACPEC